MTRSDDPFGDLPEWKERQRLQETQQSNDADQQHLLPPHTYAEPPAHAYAAEPHDANYAPLPPSIPESAPQNYQPDPNEHIAPAALAPLHYDLSHGNPPAQTHAYAPPAVPTGYQVDANGQPLAEFAEGQLPQHYPAEQFPHQSYAQEAYSQETYAEQPQLRGPHYEQAAGYAPNEYAADPFQSPTYDSQQQQGQQQQGMDGSAPADFQPAPSYPAPSYYDSTYDPQSYDAALHEPAHQDQWSPTAVAAAAPLAGAVPTQQDDEYDDDEYDDDEPERYSWKLLAAVVVTGAVVAGGGVVLYDSFSSGRAGKSGKAPIVRAERSPTKTAPKDAGGRKFAHRDSKILGRLDNSGGSANKRRLDSETGNRVRSVPTVRIGRDGRLILPKAPEPVPTQRTAAVTSSPAGAEQSTPGINVVGTSRLGGLPPVLPKAAQPLASAPRSTPVRRPAVPEIKPRSARSQVPTPVARPVIKNRPAVNRTTNRATANRATTRRTQPPPVPARSSVGTPWRMTSTSAPAGQKPSSSIRPTIARSVATPAAPRRPTPAKTASTLGAQSVARTQRRGYVAVLATESSRVKALQSFAELQQKHPNALVNRVPDVQRADLKARGLGIMYRVVVGPAGSRSAANSVCSSLKSEGYSGCWVKSN